MVRVGTGMWPCRIQWAEWDGEAWLGGAAVVGEGGCHITRGAVSSGKCAGWSPRMSPSLDVNGFKLRDLDPKLRVPDGKGLVFPEKQWLCPAVMAS